MRIPPLEMFRDIPWNSVASSAISWVQSAARTGVRVWKRGGAMQQLLEAAPPELDVEGQGDDEVRARDDERALGVGGEAAAQDHDRRVLRRLAVAQRGEEGAHRLLGGPLDDDELRVEALGLLEGGGEIRDVPALDPGAPEYGLLEFGAQVLRRDEQRPWAEPSRCTRRPRPILPRVVLRGDVERRSVYFPRWSHEPRSPTSQLAPERGGGGRAHPATTTPPRLGLHRFPGRAARQRRRRG